MQTLSPAQLEAAKKETEEILTSKVDKVRRSAMPTVRDCLAGRPRTAVQNGLGSECAGERSGRARRQGARVATKR